jgi:predicted RNase H-like nuclease
MNQPTAGIDGCRGGWVIVCDGIAWVAPSFHQALTALPDSCVIALDMPIGLLDHHQPGGRTCDQAARTLLGRARASSVFSPPPRNALGVRTLADAQRNGARITLQTLNILPKIEEVDEAMTPLLQTRVHEVHPELAFAALNDGNAVAANKKTPEGRAQRIELLERAGVTIPAKPRGAAVDDLLDACALHWSAQRIADDEHEFVPGEPAPTDVRGLAMRISW